SAGWRRRHRLLVDRCWSGGSGRGIRDGGRGSFGSPLHPSCARGFPFLALFGKRIRTAFEQTSAFEPVGSRARIGLCALLILVLAFFVITIERQAFLHRRMGDLGVYFRAAWAASVGADIYAVT